MFSIILHLNSYRCTGLPQRNCKWAGLAGSWRWKFLSPKYPAMCAPATSPDYKLQAERQGRIRVVYSSPASLPTPGGSSGQVWSGKNCKKWGQFLTNTGLAGWYDTSLTASPDTFIFTYLALNTHHGLEDTLIYMVVGHTLYSSLCIYKLESIWI